MAAYNYGYPMTYQPMQLSNNYQNMQPHQQMNYMPPQQSNQGIIWVQGEAAAKAYPVAPGSNVLLMDSEGECFYIKSTDASGMPQPLRVYEYKEIVRSEPQLLQNSTSQSNFNPDDYVKKEELEAVKKQLNDIRSRDSQSILKRKEQING